MGSREYEKPVNRDYYRPDNHRNTSKHHSPDHYPKKSYDYNRQKLHYYEDRRRKYSRSRSPEYRGNEGLRRRDD
jgi:hypothetical protein